MPQSKHRKHVKHQQQKQKKKEPALDQKSTLKAAIVMMSFFGIGGLAVGYILSDSIWGIVLATLAGILIGLFMNKIFTSAAKSAAKEE
jgi:hypothetical protein